MERGTIDKQFLTTLADNLREIQGTSEKLTPQELIDGYKVLKSEETIYTSLNEMTFGAGYTLTLNNFNGDVVYYALGNSDDFTQITSETLVLNNVTTIKFKTKYYNSNSGGAAFYIKKNGSTILTIYNDIETLTIDEDTTLTCEWGPFSGGGSD